jgi:large subunit ribosomal protein LX
MPRATGLAHLKVRQGRVAAARFYSRAPFPAQAVRMRAFRVSGEYEHGALKHWSRFHYEFICDTEDQARERVLSLLGSKHRVPRRDIQVTEVKAITADEATDPVVVARLQKGSA